MKNLLRFLLLPPLLALAGCCANTSCPCNDTLADSIYLTLRNNPASDSAFTAAELDTVYLTRYLIRRGAMATIPPPDSIPLTVTALRRQQRRTPLLAEKLKLAGLNQDSTKINTIVLSNTSPFRPGSAVGKLSDYRYELLIQDKSVLQRKSYLFKIDSVQLAGQYKADGCCTCYQNKKKVVFLTKAGATTQTQPDVTETDGGGEHSMPVPIVLVKP